MGNVYMEADQVRFKNSTYHNLQTAVSAALEGGGGGGTTVVANPEGSATADLAKLQVGETIYGIPAEAGDISYDNTSSGMTADDVQEAIDELNTGISGITELIPSDATSSNKLATADDIPGVATTSAPGIVQPDGTTITISEGVITAVGGSATVIPVPICSLSYPNSGWTSDQYTPSGWKYQAQTPSSSEISALDACNLVLIEIISVASGYNRVLSSNIVNVATLKAMSVSDRREDLLGSFNADYSNWLYGYLYYQATNVIWRPVLYRKDSTDTSDIVVKMSRFS